MPQSKNFTSDAAVLVPPTVPIHHYSDPETNRNRVRIMFHNPMLTYSKRLLAWNTLIYSKVKVGAYARPNKGPDAALRQRRPPRARPLAGCGRHERRFSTTGVSTATTFVYAIGAGVTAAAGTRLALQLYSIKVLNCSHYNPETEWLRVVISCHYLTESALGNLRACCLPWM